MNLDKPLPLPLESYKKPLPAISEEGVLVSLKRHVKQGMSKLLFQQSPFKPSSQRQEDLQKPVAPLRISTLKYKMDNKPFPAIPHSNDASTDEISPLSFISGVSLLSPFVKESDLPIPNSTLLTPFQETDRFSFMSGTSALYTHLNNNNKSQSIMIQPPEVPPKSEMSNGLTHKLDMSSRIDHAADSGISLSFNDKNSSKPIIKADCDTSCNLDISANTLSEFSLSNIDADIDSFKKYSLLHKGDDIRDIIIPKSEVNGHNLDLNGSESIEVETINLSNSSEIVNTTKISLDFSSIEPPLLSNINSSPISPSLVDPINSSKDSDLQDFNNNHQVCNSDISTDSKSDVSSVSLKVVDKPKDTNYAKTSKVILNEMSNSDNEGREPCDKSIIPEIEPRDVLNSNQGNIKEVPTSLKHLISNIPKSVEMVSSPRFEKPFAMESSSSLDTRSIRSVRSEFSYENLGSKFRSYSVSSVSSVYQNSNYQYTSAVSFDGEYWMFVPSSPSKFQDHSFIPPGADAFNQALELSPTFCPPIDSFRSSRQLLSARKTADLLNTYRVTVQRSLFAKKEAQNKALLDMSKFCIDGAGALTAAEQSELKKEAFGILRTLCRSGVPEALFLLGRAHAEDQNYTLASALFLPAAMESFPPAATAVASLLEYGVGYYKDLQNAHEFYKMASFYGEVHATFRLAKANINGDFGVFPNVMEALNLLNLCITAPHDLGLREEAINLTVTIYEKEQRIDQAISFLENLVANKNSAAMIVFAKCHENKRLGLPQDYKKVLMYYELASKLNNPDAMFFMSDFYLRGIPNTVSVDQALAYEYCDIAAKFGHVRAQYMLGIFHENGIGVKTNKERALMWFQKSADRGHNGAIEKCRQLNMKKKK